MKRKWWHDPLIWLNGASGTLAFVATGFCAVSDSLPIPKWAALLAGSIIAGANVALHFIISDARTIKRIEREDDGAA